MTSRPFATGQPDILDVIANLSNDEVFTPPRVANALLDLLPADVWIDSTLRWLDPGCKTGVFLRQIAKRLMEGLAKEIPHEAERLHHILTNMVFGLAITELTALMSRRTLYCSKDARGPFSTVQMPTAAGNIWMERVEHSYVNGRCSECSASEAQMERENRENYAYGFIHASGRSAIKQEVDMKFDVIVGNPPYQMEADGGSRTIPLYNLFVEQAKALNPRYISMIIPSRWMAGGLGLNEFRNAMLGDRRIRRLADFARMETLFPGVDFEGGVGYFLWDRDNPGPCEVTLIRGDQTHGPVERVLDEYDVFVRDSRALSILAKVVAKNAASLTDIMGTNNEFAIGTNFTGFSQQPGTGKVKLHAIQNGRRIEGWMPREAVPRGEARIDTWKVLIPKSYGERGAIPAMVSGPPLIAAPPSVSTQTYVVVFVSTEDEAKSVESYLRTRFFRFLVSLRKISQHAPKPTYAWVPLQTWDRAWTDEDLFKRYEISQEEQAYIAEMIRAMPA